MKLGAKILLFLVVIGLTVPLPVGGVESAVWQIAGFKDFLQGRLNGVSISKDGSLGLAPTANMIFNPDEALALSLVADAHDDLYIGTGHQGKVFRVTPRGKSSLFFTAQEPDIFALAVGPGGDLYVGSSPEGKIYRVTPEGKSSVFYNPHAKYIWALLFDSAGRLYVGTGDHGQIFRVDRTGKGEAFFESNQTHIMCLAFDHKGNLLAGSVPNGLIYRINPQGKGFVIYQADLPEIHDLAVGDDGNIYAAALGGPAPQPHPFMLTPQRPAITIPTQVVTVTAGTSASSGAPNLSAQKPKQPKPQPKQPEKKKETAPSFIRPGQTLSAIAGLLKSRNRGAVIEISPNSTAQTLWSSNSESVYALALVGTKILFSTDSRGQIFELEPSRFGENLTLLTETHESVGTRLLIEGRNLYIATSNVAKLFRMETTPGDEGTYESPVKDTHFISHWGVLTWRGDTPPGTSIEFYTRSGNFERPDQTWSDWAGPYRDADGGSRITSPPARYIQWKAVLRGSGSAHPTLDEASVAYLNQNLPPEIRSLNVSNAGERISSTSLSSGASSGATVSVTSMPNVNYAVPAPPQEAGKLPITLKWQANDPNGDTLVYSIYVKSADEKSWHLLKDKIKSESYTIEPSSLADGQYVARLVASDAPSNTPSTAREDAMLSAPFWVDNTPPVVSVVRKTVQAGEAIVQFRAEDPISPLHNAQSSIDSHGWVQIESDDGIIDARTETFTVKARELGPGEHVISVRAYDTAGNVGVGKAVVEVPGN